MFLKDEDGGERWFGLGIVEDVKEEATASFLCATSFTPFAFLWI